FPSPRLLIFGDGDGVSLRTIGTRSRIEMGSTTSLQIDCRLELFSVIIYGMQETSIETPAGFNELPKAEQVRYLQALWDQISANPDEVPVPESHLRLAEDRLHRYREEPANARPAFEVIDRLARKSK